MIHEHGQDQVLYARIWPIDATILFDNYLQCRCSYDSLSINFGNAYGGTAVPCSSTQRNITVELT